MLTSGVGEEVLLSHRGSLPGVLDRKETPYEIAATIRLWFAIARPLYLSLVNGLGPSVLPDD